MLLTTPEKIAFFVVLVLSTGYFAKRSGAVGAAGAPRQAGFRIPD